MIIKRNIFKKNKRSHSDLSPEQSRDILKSALYNPDLYGQSPKTSRPYNWVVINTVDEKGKNRIVLLELNPNKDNIEVVHWHYIGNGGLERIKKQAEREGEHILVLPSSVEEEAGALPGRPSDLSSENKDSEKSTESNTPTSEETSQPTEAQKDVLGRIFGMSPEEVEKEHKARKSRKKDNEQGKKIEDFGEKIAGARKDRLRELSKNLEDATEESFVALALSKAFKRPNTKKLVEDVQDNSDTRFRKDFTASDIAEMETPILQSKGTFKNLEEAEKWAKANLQGKEYQNKFTGRNIRIGRKSIKEMLNPKSTMSLSVNMHIAALRSVPDFIETGIPAEVHPDTHGRAFDVMRLYSAIEIKGEVYRVKSTIKKISQGDRFYTYEVQKMELIEGSENTVGSPRGTNHMPRSSSINSISGAKLLKGVKKTNSDELILPEDEDNTRFRKEQIHTKQFGGTIFGP